jgi:hypothetical protein
MNSLTKLELDRTFTADVPILSPVSSVQFVNVVKIVIPVYIQPSVAIHEKGRECERRKSVCCPPLYLYKYCI